MNREFLAGLTAEFWKNPKALETSKLLNVIAQSFAVKLLCF